jgi:hypothetical protein
MDSRGIEYRGHSTVQYGFSRSHSVSFLTFLKILLADIVSHWTWPLITISDSWSSPQLERERERENNNILSKGINVCLFFPSLLGYVLFSFDLWDWFLPSCASDSWSVKICYSCLFYFVCLSFDSAFQSCPAVLTTPVFSHRHRRQGWHLSGEESSSRTNKHKIRTCLCERPVIPWFLMSSSSLGLITNVMHVFLFALLPYSLHYFFTPFGFPWFLSLHRDHHDFQDVKVNKGSVSVVQG